MSKKKSSHRNKGLVFEELEPRLLLSADPLAVATDAGGSSIHELVVDNNEDQVAIVQTQVEQSLSPARNELVIIDSRAPNFQQLHNDLIEAQQQGRNVHVVILDAHRDGIEQINEALSSHNKLDALHIVSHGDDAQVQLGASQLNKTTLRDRSADIAQWRQAFSEDGDLLIYGCDLASSSEGRSMVHALGYLTATDVAASDDLTGNSLNGGDWELEYEAGDIETGVAFSEQVQDNWQGTLEASAPVAQEEQAVEEQQQEQQAQAELLEQQTTRSQEDQETTREDEQQQQIAITQQQRQEVVFIDESVTDFQAFIDDLQNNSDGSTTFEIVLLNGDNSGIEQINDALAGYNEVDALHILSHGDDGSVKLGNTWLNVSNIDQHGENLSAWGDALDQDGDILIYGCNLAESAIGEQFVTELAQLTGADVAASNDNTGHALLNGDWELEYRHGAIETSVALSDDIQSNWTNVLANFTVDTNADTVDDNPGDGLAQDASGNTSLRAAIEEANALGGANTITLAADTYTLGATGELLITSDITITGAGADQTFIDGNFLSRVLHTQGGVTVTITDVTILNGDASGGGNGGALWIDGATDNVTLERVKLINNTADTGGAIYNQGGTLTFTDGVISGNSAIGGGLNGGGLDNEGTAVLERVTISGNTASNGGGIYTGSAGSSLTMTNSTISGNNATMGGGISAYNTATLTNVTITLNNATNATGGSGIHRSGGSGSVQLKNTIVAGNTGTEDMLGNSYTSLGNNLIGTPGNATDFTDGVNGDQVGTSASPIDPLLDPLADNGGFAQTHALQAGSTAINNGTGTGAPATDQRGTLRDDGFIDIGAYEFASNTQALLWMTFENDEGGTGNTDIPSISGGDVVTFSDITQLETSNSDPLAATTSGSFAYQFNLDTVLLSDGVTLASDGNTRVNALHYVNSDIQVGTNNVQLYGGDLLLSTDAAETIDGVTYEKEDVFVFRPDTTGDYSQGSFFRLIDGKNDTGWGNVTAVSLAEQSAVVGDVTLNAGEFLVAHSGSDKNILRFTPGTLGDATTGTTTVLVDGTDVDVGSSIGGLHLVQSDTVIGGVALSPGQILATLHGDDANLADNTINADRHDIVILDVTATGSGTSAATAARFFEGLDQSLDSNPETVWGVTLQENVNNGPVNTVPGAQSTDEDVALTFNAANGNLISISAGAGEVLTTTISVTQGSLNLSQTTGLTFDAGANGTATMTVTGTVEDINAALDGLQYMPSTDYNGADTLTLTSRDAALYSLEIDSNLVGRYEFNATAPGDDSSPSGTNNGTLVGNATVVSDPERGDMISLDGTGDYATINGFFGNPANVTLSAWVNLTAADTEGSDVISLGDNVGLRLDNPNGGNGVWAYFYDGGGWTNIASGEFVAGTGWHHVAYVFDDNNNTHTIYIDGAAVNSEATATSISYTNGTNTIIGAHGNGQTVYDFNGLIDDARIYDRALSAAEIDTLANAPVQSSDSDTVAITVNAVNDAPIIASNGGGDTANINVAENTAAVTTVTATDADLDTLTYSIDPASDDAAFFSINGSGELTFVSAPNYEAWADNNGDNIYEVTVRVSDGNGGIDTQAISVTVTDVLELAVTNTNATGTGSLYEAILNANANSGVTDTITFNIPGAGPHVINLTTALPAITDTVIIDGTTDPDYAGDPIIQIDGSALGAGVNGLTFTSTSDGSEVKGLMITNFTQHGIQVDSGTDGITISNNWIGTTGTGSVGDGNGDTGIYIQGANTIVGGTGLNDGNVITNNGNEGINITGAGATGTIIQGNIIGLDPDGATGSGNIDVGIALLSGAHNTTIGGSTAAARNIISNNVEGIEINSNNNTVQGNYIGTDVSGTLDRGNRSDDGVELQNGATGNLIGGSGAGEGNLIAFNARDGVYVFNGTGNAVLGNRIHSNTGLGIDLGVNGVNANDVNDVDAGANELQNFPVLSSVLTNGINTIAIEGSLNSTANTDFRIEFFASTVADASGYGEAERYLGSVNISTDAGGNAAFSVNLTDVVAAGEFITATATIDLGGSNYGSTSEFAQSVPAVLSNFAPTLDNTGIMALTSIKENEVNSNGDLVSDIIASAGGNRITDPDVGAVEGMAIIAVDDTNGTWEYSTDGGSNWTAFGAVTNNSAVVLTDTGNDRIRFVPNAGFSGVATFTFHAWDTTDALASGTTGVDASIIGGSTAFSTATEEVRVEVLPTEIRILFTTQSDINNSGVPGIKSWTTGDVLAIGDPNLSFEPLGSDGSVYRYLDLGVLTADNDMQMQGLHYVSRDVTVGSTNSVDLQRGDILFVSQNAETMTSTNSLSFAAGDVIAFRPDTPGDYTSGTFIHVIDKPGTQQTTGISLVEQDILVGDTTLLAGTFLFTQEDTGLGEGNNIYHFSADDAGAGTTTGTVSTLITGTDIDIQFNEFIGVMLVTEDMPLNGTTVAAGSIITSLANGDVTTGDNTIATNEDEIIYLTATTTTMGATITTTADATVLFDGGDIGLNNNQKKMRSLGFIEIVGTLNVDPVISLPGGGINFTEGDPPSVIDASATLVDPDSADFDGGVLRVDITGNGTANDRLAVRHEGTAAGQVGVSGNNVTYGGIVIGAFSGGTTGTDPLFVNFNTSADVAAVQAVMRNITFENTSTTPSTSQRTVEFTVTDGDLGNSGAVSTTVDVTDVVTANAPVATDDPGGYSATVSSYNPLSYWRFGETSGTSTSDNGSTSNSGTFNGVTLGQTGAISGDINTAISFDGTDDYVVMPHDDAYLIDDGTIQLWFNADDLSSDQGLISKDSSGFDTGGHFTIRVLTDGSIEVRLQSDVDSNFMSSGAGTVTAGSWHHVAVTFGASGMELFLDGVSVDTNPYTGGMGTTSGDIGNYEPIAIGASTRVSGNGTVTPLQDFFGGSIDEVAIMDQALTAEQIQDIYASALQNYTIAEDTSLVVSAAEGVLSNDSDADADPLTAVLDTGPSNAAAFNLNADGSFSYTPVANFSGTDTFTYIANDGSGNSNVATVTITITGDNDAPVNTVPVSATVLEDTQTAIAGLSVADPDAGVGAITTQLTVTNGVLDVTLAGTATISAGANGSNTLTISGNVTDINTTLASLQYTGNANINGVAADTLTMVTNDLGNTGTGGALSDTSNVQIDISAVNDAPVARDDRIGLVFDGVDDYVTIGDYAGLNVTTNVTMEAWIKPTGLGTGSKIIVNKEGEYEMGITAETGEVKWAFDNIDPNWVWHNTGYFVQAGEWTHLAVTYDNGVVNTYANGVLVDSYNGSGAIADNYLTMNQLQIGGRENALDQRFDGQIDEVRIWNSTRSQLDIQNNMNTLLTGAEAGLIGNWRFDEGSGITVEDQSVFGHHGTLADGVTAGEMPAWQGYVVSEDGILTVTALNGVLPNDYDIDGDPLTAVLDTGPINAAAFNLNPDGSFTYTPAADFNGIDSFTYHANDGTVDSNIATVTIRVYPVNDAPQATSLNAAETYTEDTALNLTDIVVSDVDSANVTVTLILSDPAAGSLNTATSGSVTSIFAGDTWTASGAIADVNTLLAGLTFTPSLNYNSNFSIATSVDDGVAPAITGSKAMTGTPVNDAPQATNLNAAETYTEDTALNLTDIVVSDVDSANVTVTLILSDPAAGALNTDTSGSVTSTFVGDTWTASGAIDDVNTLLAGLTFAPSLNYNSNFSIATSVSDGVAPAITGTKVMTGMPVNDVPVANANTVTTTEDNAYNFTAADFSFSDVESDSLVSARITNILLGGGTLTYGGGTAVISGNTLTAAQLNTLVYTPPASANGSPLATFDFTVNDADLGVVTAQMSINVTAVNNAPTATNLNAAETYTEDTALNLTDIVVSDVDSANVTVTLILSDPAAGSLNTATSGSVTSTFVGDTWTASGAIDDVNTLLAGLTFTPSLNYNSNFSIATSVDDGVAPAITGTKVMTGTPVNDVPVATANSVTTNEDAAFNFAATDFTFTDVEGDSLISATITGLNLNGGTLVHSGSTAVTNGMTLTAAELDTLVYTPALNANGTPLATFDFTVNDSGMGVTSAQMSINVTAQPDPAVIGGVDTGVVTEDLDPDMDNQLEVSGSLTILDPDAGEQMFVTGPVGGTYGVITMDAAGNWDYAANTNQAAIQGLAAGATLLDTITVSSVDGTTHDINITIMGTNDAPVAGNDVANVNEGSAVIIDVAATDSDIDDALDLNSIIITGLPTNGNVVVNGGGTVTYTHDGSETLLDSFTYTISDISGAVSNSATVTVNINPVNDSPAAANDTATVAEGNAVMIDLAANDSDVDNALDLNSINIIGAPANGTLVVNVDGTVTYTHDGSNTVSDSFTYTISDISGAISNTATVNITITAVNNAPTTTGIADVAVSEDAANTDIDLNAAFDDTDNLDSELTYSIVGNNNIGLFTATGIDGATGRLTLDYAADMNGSAQIAVRATDPAGLSVDTLFTVTVTPVNDAPVVQANTGMLASGTAQNVLTSSELNVTDIDNTNAEITYTVTALPANGALLLNGTVMAVNDTFTQADLDNNLLAYQPAGTAAADQFGFTVADSSGAALSNNTFDILVQVAANNDDGDTDNVVPPDNGDTDEEPEPEDSSGPGDDGLPGDAGEYGGGYVPFGSTSAPQVPPPALSIDPVPEKPSQERVIEKEGRVAEAEVHNVETFAAVQVKSMDALWGAIDKMKQEMGGSSGDKMSPAEFKVAAAKSSGVVLTAGVVAWILRSGALLSSLMSTIPLWKGYDPLPILAYKDDEEKKEEDEIHEDKIPTSLEELQKLKKLKEKKSREVDVDSIFGGSAIRE